MYLFNLALLDLTWREVVADIPVDATALVLYAVCLLCGVLVWQGSRPKRGKSSVPALAEAREAPAAERGMKAVAAEEDRPAAGQSRPGKRRRSEPNKITWIIS